MSTIVLAVAVLLLGMVGSAVFAGLETGTYVLNKVRLELRTGQGHPQARRLSRAMARPQELLIALLIATNVTQYLVAMPAVALFELAGSDNAQLCAVATVTPLLFVFGDMVPKNIFRVAGETLTYRLSAVLAVTAGVCRWLGLSPVVLAVSRAILRLWPGERAAKPSAMGARQRVHSFLAEGHAHGVLTRFQSRMASRVIDMRSTTAGEVMVTLPGVVAIPADCSRDAFIETLAGHNYSRLPVWRDEPANIVGIVNIYEVLLGDDPSAAPTRHMLPPIHLSETLPVAEALITLQRARRAMGIVTRGDKAVGIITIKDLVEEIVGELGAW